ncbi:MAG: hypothetical protein WD534_07515 [Phycisphaeraceae bacterium]
MSDTTIDMQKVHHHFAADCFNRTWELIVQRNRTAEQAQQMIHCAHASRWHWSQVADHTPNNLAIGDWLLARVYALTERPDEAMSYARPALQLAVDHDLGPFFIAYGHEAVARAAAVADDVATCSRHTQQMHAAILNITDSEDRDMLLQDLDAFPIVPPGPAATA